MIQDLKLRGLVFPGFCAMPETRFFRKNRVSFWPQSLCVLFKQAAVEPMLGCRL